MSGVSAETRKGLKRADGALGRASVLMGRAIDLNAEAVRHIEDACELLEEIWRASK